LSFLFWLFCYCAPPLLRILPLIPMALVLIRVAFPLLPLALQKIPLPPPK